MCQEQSSQTGAKSNHRRKVIGHGLTAGQDQLILGGIPVAVSELKQINSVNPVIGRIDAIAAERGESQLIVWIAQNAGGREAIAQLPPHQVPDRSLQLTGCR